jgi:hypothetical protein
MLGQDSYEKSYLHMSKRAYPYMETCICVLQMLHLITCMTYGTADIAALHGSEHLTSGPMYSIPSGQMPILR